MRYLIKPMETEAEIDGKGYVHWMSWQESYTGLINQDYLDSKMTLENCLRTAHRWPDNILVAKDGDKVIGFTGYGAYRDDTLPGYGEVYAIYVLQEYQKQGVGYALMNAALERLQAYDRIALWVLKDNKKAIAFYRKYGFAFDGAEQELNIGTPVAECRMVYQRNHHLKLVLPHPAYLESYNAARAEYEANGVSSYQFMDSRKADILERIRNYRTGEHLPPNRVPATYLWLVEGNMFIGEVTIRHKLTDALLRYAGHIGYGVRWSYWNRGVGTKMLAMALTYARDELGLTRVLITCDDDNIASARVIEKNGGVLLDKVINTFDAHAFLTRRYWIDISK